MKPEKKGWCENIRNITEVRDTIVNVMDLIALSLQDPIKSILLRISEKDSGLVTI